jgi:hypothetical protein
MKPKALAVFLSIAVSMACGGSAPTTPSATPSPSPQPAPPPAVRGTWVDAPPTTIGEVAANTNVGNTVPFGSNSVAGPSYAATTYQQVYAGSLFGSSQVRLTSIQFFPTPANTANQPLPANYTISLSTTAKAVNGLDTVNLAGNLGANQQVVFSGALGSGTIVNGLFQIAFATPFFFTPSGGNLLLQILRSNPTGTFGVGLLNHFPGDGFPTGQSSRAHDWGTGYAGFFLVTRFQQQRCECPPGQQCTC